LVKSLENWSDPMQDELTDHPTVETSTEPDDELWDRQKVLEYFGGTKPIHLSTLYRGVNDGRYPPPISVSANVVRWIPCECRAARQRMIAARGNPKLTTLPRRGRPPRRITP
jgi:predicted DNA-binding transcriptional regulator AlpA